MDIKDAVCVLETIGSGSTLSNINDKEAACVVAIKALDTLEKIKNIIQEDTMKCLTVLIIHVLTKQIMTQFVRINLSVFGGLFQIQ